MNSINKKLLLLFSIITLFAIACKKETDTDNPVVTITSPTEGQMFGIGDSALVAFTVTDADTHGYDFAIINTANDSVLLEVEEHTHANVTFSQQYKLPSAAMNMRLIVIGEDHSENKTTKGVDFHTM